MAMSERRLLASQLRQPLRPPLRARASSPSGRSPCWYLSADARGNDVMVPARHRSLYVAESEPDEPFAQFVEAVQIIDGRAHGIEIAVHLTSREALREIEVDSDFCTGR